MRVLARERALRALLAQHVVLLGRQFLLPLGIRLLDLLRHRRLLVGFAMSPPTHSLPLPADRRTTFPQRGWVGYGNTWRKKPARSRSSTRRLSTNCSGRRLRAAGFSRAAAST